MPRSNIVRNGKKHNGSQHYLGKDCRRQFISDHEKSYRGRLSGIANLVKIMLVRGVGIRDISVILNIRLTKMLKILASGVYAIQSQRKYYDCLGIDEFWTYMGEDKEQSLAYVAYHRESGAIVRYGGKWDLKTTRKLRKRIKQWGITCDRKRSRLG